MLEYDHRNFETVVSRQEKTYFMGKLHLGERPRTSSATQIPRLPERGVGTSWSHSDVPPADSAATFFLRKTQRRGQKQIQEEPEAGRMRKENCIVNVISDARRNGTC